MGSFPWYQAVPQHKLYQCLPTQKDQFYTCVSMSNNTRTTVKVDLSWAFNFGEDLRVRGVTWWGSFPTVVATCGHRVMRLLTAVIIRLDRVAMNHVGGSVHAHSTRPFFRQPISLVCRRHVLRTEHASIKIQVGAVDRDQLSISEVFALIFHWWKMISVEEHPAFVNVCMYIEEPG